MENKSDAQGNARRRQDYEAAAARTKQALRKEEEKREEYEWEHSGGKKEWEDRVRKRRRADIVLWNVGDEEDKATSEESAALPQQNTYQDSTGPPPNSGFTQLVQAAGDPGLAPRFEGGPGIDIGGVEVIDAGGIAVASQGKEVVFGDDGDSIATNETDEAASTYQLTDEEEKLDTQDLAIDVKPWRKRKQELKRRTGVPVDDESSDEGSDSSRDTDHGEKGEWGQMEDAIKSFLR